MHLFAGAGGGILADILLGHVPVCAVEIDHYCRQVLDQRQADGCLPWFPIFDDVRDFDGARWRGLVDVVAGGFPCQDISAAGKGAGIDGQRSGLWREMARVIGEVRPRFAFVENSPMLVGRGLGRVCGDLAEMGYDATWGVVSAGQCGAVHIRERLWILATDSMQKRKQGKRPKALRGLQIIPWGENVRGPADVRTRPDLFGPVLCGTRDAVPDFVDRLAAVGNAQVPLVAALAWRILAGDL